MNELSAPSLSRSQACHIGQIFFQRAQELGERPFIKLQQDDGSKNISWRDFARMTQNVVLALFALGLAPGDAVAILGENSLERVCADLATLAAGFPNVVLSPGLSDTMLARVLAHAKCRAAFVQDAAIAARVLNFKEELAVLSNVFVMEKDAAQPPGTLSFDDLIEKGQQADARRFAPILEAVRPGDLATIMYTSGSTGEPKGVMRTQDNLLSNITNGGAIKVGKPDELFVMVLSVNHLLGRFGFLKSAVTGRTTAIIRSTELDLDLKVVEALSGTAMALVPRVMERIWREILDRSDHRRRWEMLEALDKQRTRGALGEADSNKFTELRDTLRAATLKALGGRITYISYSGAAMPPRIMRFFELVGIPLIGSYGSTECGGVTLCGISENRPGNLGKPFPNVEVRIAADSEILVRGPTVSPGYFANPEATREVFDADGWFHTGDLGALEADGSLRIIGRKKDVFYCADGSNIYPAFIELQLENEPLIRQAVLLGDRRPFIAALIVPARASIAESLGRAEPGLTDADLQTAVWSSIERVNARLEHYEQIRKVRLMARDFPAEVRSINVFQKIKVDRKLVAERYQKEIDDIYSASREGEGY